MGLIIIPFLLTQHILLTTIELPHFSINENKNNNIKELIKLIFTPNDLKSSDLAKISFHKL